jgi:class 3 adenylate cyclase
LSAALEVERKFVTVLFADLKGSMELVADREPEKARRLLDPVLEHMCEAVEQYGGTVSKVMGDGIMALFGAPIAAEDPLRAGSLPQAKSIRFTTRSASQNGSCLEQKTQAAALPPGFNDCFRTCWRSALGRVRSKR